MATDFKSLGKNEQGALIAGALAIILSFFGSYVTVTVSGHDLGGTSAWHSYATLGVLLVIAATAIVAFKAFAAQSLPDGVPWSLVALAAAALGTLLLILRALFPGGPDLGGYSVGPGWSAYVLWIASLALTYFTFRLFQASGEKMPEMNKKDNTPPAA
jgi:hypothetical protein